MGQAKELVRGVGNKKTGTRKAGVGRDLIGQGSAALFEHWLLSADRETAILLMDTDDCSV
ncbi:MAG: hypothetical protein ABIO65_05145 [Nitrospiria bacterium]